MFGSNRANVHHAKIHMGCSGLNFDHCHNIHEVDNPSFSCGSPLETAYHYFVDCPHYNNIRQHIIDAIQSIMQPSLNVVLYGHNDVSLNENKTIFDAVQRINSDSIPDSK